MTDQRWWPSAESGGQVVGRFVKVKRLNIPESLEADEHRYREVIVLEHKAAASTDVSVTPMKPYNERELRARFPEAWKAFNGDEAEVEGTKLRELKFLTEEQIIFLNLNGIYVVEQLAGLSDARCQGLGFGWRSNRNRAQGFVKEQIERIAREDRIEREQARAKRSSRSSQKAA